MPKDTPKKSSLNSKTMIAMIAIVVILIGVCGYFVDYDPQRTGAIVGRCLGMGLVAALVVSFFRKMFKSK